MFEFEGFSAIYAFESPEHSRLLVRDHVSLKAIHVGEMFIAHLATLKTIKKIALDNSNNQLDLKTTKLINKTN